MEILLVGKSGRWLAWVIVEQSTRRAALTANHSGNVSVGGSMLAANNVQLLHAGVTTAIKRSICVWLVVPTVDTQVHLGTSFQLVGERKDYI